MTLTPEEIAAKADQLRTQKVSLGNYQQIVNDVLVLIRELAKNMKAK
jgi:hypothetical protein